MSDGASVVVGIDVGSTRKGFHAVGLNDRIATKFSSTDPKAIATWCKELGATVVAVDSPITWSATGRARPAERALMTQRIWCFSSPTEKAAREHPKNYFGWMLNGACLYRELGKYYALYDGTRDRSRPICFETIPHAIACALAGAIVPARDKCRVRRQLLKDAGIACDLLTNIDYVDAGICALAAMWFTQGHFVRYGDPVEGFIVVPRLRKGTGR